MSLSAGSTAKLSPQLVRALSVSIEQYRAILSQLQQIKGALPSADDSLTPMVRLLNTQQREAGEHDEGLITLLREAAGDVANHPLYLQRLDLIQQILQLNNLLLPDIDGMMAVISNELVDLRNGRVVLGGYQQTAQKHGRIIKSSV